MRREKTRQILWTPVIFLICQDLYLLGPALCLPKAAGGKSWDPAQDTYATSRRANRCMRLECNQSDSISEVGGEGEQERRSLPLPGITGSEENICPDARLALKRTKPGAPGGSVC